MTQGYCPYEKGNSKARENGRKEKGYGGCTRGRERDGEPLARGIKEISRGYMCVIYSREVRCIRIRAVKSRGGAALNSTKMTI